MPLSEHEQRLLDQIEQALYADDPKFASSVRSVRTRSHARRFVMLCILGVIAGLVLVLVGLLTNFIVLSVVGFVLVVGSCVFGAQLIRNRTSPTTPDAPPAGKGLRPTGLRTRMEDRLRRRFDEN